MSRFSAFEAAVVVKASLMFFRGKFFDSNGIGVFFLLGILLGVVVVGPVVLEGKEGISLSLCDVIGLFPDVFEVKGLGIPFVQWLGQYLWSRSSS